MKKQRMVKKTASRGEALSSLMKQNSEEREQINRTFRRLQGELQKFAEPLVGKHFKSVIVDYFYDPCSARIESISIELSIRKDSNGTGKPLSIKSKKYAIRLIKALRLEKGFKFRRRNNGKPVYYYPDVELCFP